MHSNTLAGKIALPGVAKELSQSQPPLPLGQPHGLGSCGLLTQPAGLLSMGIPQARILEWVAMPSCRDLPKLGI